MKEHYIWVEKYRPTLENIILTDEVKKKTKTILKNGKLTNNIFYGGPGIGKSSFAIALCEKLNIEYLFINGTNCGVESLRTGEISTFASTLSFEAEKKCVIIDEAEKMSSAFVLGFQSFIEKYAHNCTFILTTNHIEAFSAPMRSRFDDICFDIKTKEEKRTLFLDFLNSVCTILDKEKISYNKKTVMNFLATYFPDMRRSLNTLQGSVVDGEITEAILAKRATHFDNLYDILKAKKYKDMIKYVEDNEVDFTILINEFHKNLNKFDITQWPILISNMNEYQYKHNFAINKTVNILDFLSRIMTDVKMK